MSDATQHASPAASRWTRGDGTCRRREDEEHQGEYEQDQIEHHRPPRIVIDLLTNEAPRA